MGIVRRLSALMKQSRVEREIDEELQSHLEMRAADNMAQGMTKEEASRDARRRFGNPVAVKESVQAMDVALGIDNFFADLRYALRGCLKNPGFTVRSGLFLSSQRSHQICRKRSAHTGRGRSGRSHKSGA